MPKKQPKVANDNKLIKFLTKYGQTTSTHVTKEIEFAIRRLADRTKATPDSALAKIRKMKVKYGKNAEEVTLAATHSSQLLKVLRKFKLAQKLNKLKERRRVESRVVKRMQKFRKQPNAVTQFCSRDAEKRQELLMQTLQYNLSLPQPSTHIKTNTAGSLGEDIVLAEIHKKLIELGRSTDGIECYSGSGVFDLVVFDGNKPPKHAIVVEVKFNTSGYGTRAVKYTNPGTKTVTQCTSEYYHEMLEVMAHAGDSTVNDCAKALKKLGTANVTYVALRVEGDPKLGQLPQRPIWEKHVIL